MSAVSKRCAAAFRQLGGTAFLIRGEKRFSFTASIQPRRESGGPDADTLGIGQEVHFTLFAPTGTAADLLKPGDTVEFRGGRYLVLRAEAFFFAGEPAYHWAVLRKET